MECDGQLANLPPAASHPSYNDVFALAKADDGAPVSMIVEEEVSDSFSQTAGEWIKPN